MKTQWRDGNRIALLENGEAYFPRVFEAIAAAEREVFVETFIVFDDPIGRQLQAALIAAAQRGARVELTVDGYGSADLTPEFILPMTGTGVRFHVFDPRPKLFGMRLNLFRRLHRKIVVVDGRVAFIGGLNFSFDHMRESGAQAKQDYAVEIEGPVVWDIRNAAESAVAPVMRWLAGWRSRHAPLPEPPRPPAAAGEARAAFVIRDNNAHRDDIEQHYRQGIRQARREIVIANAYFFPGYRMLRDLRNAVRRGVRVSLILQGNPDKPAMRWAAMTLYDYLLRAGVVIFEYCERPLHGKVALIDDQWTTVGSSNLDPLSLFLNLEGNLFAYDRSLNASLRESLGRVMQDHCQALRPEAERPHSRWRQALTLLAFHLSRRFPQWSGALPGHKRLELRPPAVATVDPTRNASEKAA